MFLIDILSTKKIYYVKSNERKRSKWYDFEN